jgi:hypothetical protein
MILSIRIWDAKVDKTFPYTLLYICFFSYFNISTKASQVPSNVISNKKGMRCQRIPDDID